MLSSLSVARDSESPSIRRALLLLVVVVLGLAAADRALRTWWIGRQVPSASLHWIWDPSWPREPVRPHAFQLMRRFQLDEVPDRAELLVAVDEEYRLFLNGHWVGSGRLQPLDSWHSYAVAPLLRSGENVLGAELRSSRGVGGFLLCLREPRRERCVVSSDARWTSFGEHQRRLRHGETDENEGSPVRVWGRVGTGGWPLPTGRSRRPLAEECVKTGRPMPAHRIVYLRDAGLSWKGIERKIPVWQARWRSLSRGIVGVRLAGTEGRVARLDFGRKRRAPVAPEASAVLVTQPGQEVFVATEGQWFQYLQTKGLRRIEDAWYWPTHEREDCGAYYAPDERPDPRGILGVTPPRLHSPVEHELWREFEGFPGLASRE